MKKYFAIALLITVIGTSCKKEETVKPQTKVDAVNVITKPKDTQTWD